jgi:hypothetical protein
MNKLIVPLLLLAAPRGADPRRGQRAGQDMEPASTPRTVARQPAPMPPRRADRAPPAPAARPKPRRRLTSLRPPGVPSRQPKGNARIAWTSSPRRSPATAKMPKVLYIVP